MQLIWSQKLLFSTKPYLYLIMLSKAVDSLFNTQFFPVLKEKLAWKLDDA